MKEKFKAQYVYLWRNKWITSGARSIDDFISVYEQLLNKLKRWKVQGIKLQIDTGIRDDYAEFYTFNEEVAKKEGFRKCDPEC